MERDLIRDIVFILQGISGNFIKSTPKGTFEIVTKVSFVCDGVVILNTAI